MRVEEVQERFPRLFGLEQSPSEGEEQDLELSDFLSILQDKNGFYFGDTKTKCTSIEIFMSYTYDEYGVEGGGTECTSINVDGIISRTCYLQWRATKPTDLSCPEESFRKAILAHLTCADQSSCPFPENVESALLKLLRTPRIWPCFRNTFKEDGRPCIIGMKGIRCMGFHERRRLGFVDSKSHKMLKKSQKRKFESSLSSESNTSKRSSPQVNAVV